MRHEVRIAGKSHAVELEREASCLRVRIDGQALEADAVEISPGAYSILLGGHAHEVRVTRAPGGTLKVQSGAQEFAVEILDPRSWRGRKHGALEAEGRQQITAPMPGKVVRVLVRQGDKVEAGQGVLVVEAMKMQNEVRSSKTGTVEHVLVTEGQAVNAGEILAWVE